MAVDAKLTATWNAKQTADAVFRFRAAVQNAYMTIHETVTEMDALAAGESFTTVDAEIKTAGIACRKAINDAKTALDAQAEFINWPSPS